MYEGLCKFSGKQRGWNGEHEFQLIITLRREQEAKGKKLWPEVAKESAGAHSRQEHILPKTNKGNVDAKLLEHSFMALQDRAAIAQIAADDEVEGKWEELRRMMKSRQVDMSAVIREAHQASRVQKGSIKKAASKSSPKYQSPEAPRTLTHRKRKVIVTATITVQPREEDLQSKRTG